ESLVDPAKSLHGPRQPRDSMERAAADRRRSARGLEGAALSCRGEAVSAHGPQPTKRPRDENFPIASLVLAPEYRDAVLAFYAFARLADDIADAPDRNAAEKLQRLDALEQALVSGDPTKPEAARLYAVDAQHGTGLV